eukprot:gene3274-2256_t
MQTYRLVDMMRRCGFYFFYLVVKLITNYDTYSFSEMLRVGCLILNLESVVIDIMLLDLVFIWCEAVDSIVYVRFELHVIVRVLYFYLFGITLWVILVVYAVIGIDVGTVLSWFVTQLLGYVVVCVLDVFVLRVTFHFALRVSFDMSLCDLIFKLCYVIVFRWVGHFLKVVSLCWRLLYGCFGLGCESRIGCTHVWFQFFYYLGLDIHCVRLFEFVLLGVLEAFTVMRLLYVLVGCCILLLVLDCLKVGWVCLLMFNQIVLP